MSDPVSTRVTSTRLQDYVGQSVRLVAKTLRIQGNTAMVETSDGGQVEVRLPPESALTDTWNEIVGTVVDGSTVKMANRVGMGSEIDAKTINDIIELSHDKKWHDQFFK